MNSNVKAFGKAAAKKTYQAAFFVIPAVAGYLSLPDTVSPTYKALGAAALSLATFSSLAITGLAVALPIGMISGGLQAAKGLKTKTAEGLASCAILALAFGGAIVGYNFSQPAISTYLQNNYSIGK